MRKIKLFGFVENFRKKREEWETKAAPSVEIFDINGRAGDEGGADFAIAEAAVPAKRKLSRAEWKTQPAAAPEEATEGLLRALSSALDSWKTEYGMENMSNQVVISMAIEALSVVQERLETPA